MKRKRQGRKRGHESMKRESDFVERFDAALIPFLLDDFLLHDDIS